MNVDAVGGSVRPGLLPGRVRRRRRPALCDRAHEPHVEHGAANHSQPSWNHFWGTADESQHFQVAGATALIVHQGTLSGFDLESRDLFPIWGERDTYGGLRNPSWARNEWHGPGRGGVAVVVELLSREWAPLFVEPGLAGREFFFEQSGDLFNALAWAWPHLPPALQAAVAARLDREWTRHPPFTPEALARRVDLPFCRADLFHLVKLALVLEAWK